MTTKMTKKEMLKTVRNLIRNNVEGYTKKKLSNILKIINIKNENQNEINISMNQGFPFSFATNEKKKDTRFTTNEKKKDTQFVFKERVEECDPSECTIEEYEYGVRCDPSECPHNPNYKDCYEECPHVTNQKEKDRKIFYKDLEKMSRLEFANFIMGYFDFRMEEILNEE